MRGFFASRSIISKALGKQCYMINPKRCLCPFVSTKRKSKCKIQHTGTVELNRLNDLDNLIAHLKTQHDDIEAALIAAARIDKVKNFPQIKDPQLAFLAKEIDWNDAGDSVRQITDQGDSFEPPFELGTNEHANWVKDTIAEFEQVRPRND